MSTITMSGPDLGPFLVSELPPALPTGPTLWTRLARHVAARREVHSFERAVRFAGHTEYSDLLAARRRD